MKTFLCLIKHHVMKYGGWVEVGYVGSISVMGLFELN